MSLSLFAAKTAKMPQHIRDAFVTKSINIDNLLAFEYSDMSESGEFADVWIAFDKEYLYIMIGYDKVTKKRGNKRLKVIYEISSFDLISLEKIKKLEIERFISTARLVAYENVEPSDESVMEINSFSLGIANRMDKLVRRFNTFKEGKPLEEEAFSTDEEIFCPKCGALYPDQTRKICPKCMDKKSITVRLLGFFKYYYKNIFIFFALMLVNTVFSVISPYIGTKMLYDDVLTPGGSWYGEVLAVILLIVGVRLFSLLLSILQGYISGSIVPYVVYDIKLKIFTSMQRLSVSFYTSKQTGSLMSRVHRDANNIYWFFVDGFPYLLINIITFIGVLAIMIMMNWQLSIIIAVMIPVIIVLYRVLWRIFHKMYHAQWVHDSNMTSHISDSMSGQRVIKAFAKEQEESDRFATFSAKSRNATLRTSNAENTAFPLIGLLTIFANLLVLSVGGIMIVNGTYDMTLGKLMTFTAYMNMLYGPLDFLSWVSSWWARCVDSAQRIFEVIDAVPDVMESENPVSLPDLKGDIELKDVLFEYEPGRPIIKGLSLSVKAGDMVGIVGKTGAGKTTIVNLMARLYDVKEGYIKIDGVDVRDIAMADMRKNIGIVSQEIYLFIGTIADNIRYAKPESTMEEVISAAKAASAHDFIMRLPDAYETRVGSGGQDLSGGEKQRLSIARTIIQNPKILILDEATASMDTETERRIQDSLAELKEGRTTIAIAHRLSTLRDADVLSVIDDGNMVEYGTHEELIQKKGAYYNLYKLQFEAIKHIGITG